ncbi:MAG: L-histidine N(alpha)-methyltransferase [Gammaproteobacteria bacterium]
MTRNAVSPARAIRSPCYQVPPARQVPGLFEDVRNGLLSRPRSLPPKYFYDDRGSELFERICSTQEYYPTRTEDALLAEHSKHIIAATRPDEIIELGSGSSRKTRRLFDACEALDHACNYSPFDVCEPALEQATDELSKTYPWLEITPLAGDYHAGLGNFPAGTGTSLYIFLGSTLGNFTREQAKDFIREVHDCMKPGDYFLLGADRLKDPRVLKAAYNDSQGITAQFNLNVLRVLNRELNADFEPASFEHKAVFNERESRIEMHLQSGHEQTVHLHSLGKTIHLQKNECILTEYSHKFRYQELQDLLTDNGLEIMRHDQPRNEYFSLILSRRP